MQTKARFPKLAALLLLLLACGDDGGGDDWNDGQVSQAIEKSCITEEMCGSTNWFSVDQCVDGRTKSHDRYRHKTPECRAALLKAYECYAGRSCDSPDDTCEAVNDDVWSICKGWDRD